MCRIDAQALIRQRHTAARVRSKDGGVEAADRRAVCAGGGRAVAVATEPESAEGSASPLDAAEAEATGVMRERAGGIGVGGDLEPFRVEPLRRGALGTAG